MSGHRGLLPACAAAALLLALGVRSSAHGGDVHSVFERGLAALHQFEYEDANEAFRQAQRVDPGFAMAYWGEAMTYNQTLWRNEDVAAARQVLARLGSTTAVRGRATTPQERAWLSAIEILIGEGNETTRH